MIVCQVWLLSDIRIWSQLIHLKLFIDFYDILTDYCIKFYHELIKGKELNMNAKFKMTKVTAEHKQNF